MKYKRSAGILLHPTSLPGRYGIGDLGPQAHLWLEFLQSTGCGLWQVLPLGPTGYGDSPYQSFSAFAGNPNLISPELLLEDQFLVEQDFEDMPEFPNERVDFGPLIDWKTRLLDKAFDRYRKSGSQDQKNHVANFWAEQSNWLSDFALFMAIKEEQGGGPWSDWPLPLRLRDTNVLQKARQDLDLPIQRQIFRQWLFFRQWEALRAKATEIGVNIIGDIPIFVAHDSADVWAHPELFFLDEEGYPTVVAGVPPDYFSPTGQLWGNPLYRWDIHAETGYAWWIDRFRAVLNMVDIARLDHFRGFAGYWEIPAGNPTAEIGQWVPGPGISFLKFIRNVLGELPIIAEDLGVITPDVVDMRETFGLPGMKILQFGFASDPDDPFLPHNYPSNCVAYTGTHDNDTVLGWYETAPEEERNFCRRYLNCSGDDITWDMIRILWGSVAMFTLAPMQDLLSLGPEARMNFPGKPSGNWDWRMKGKDTSSQMVDKIRDINYLFSRLNLPDD
jgi:4-alpha-glucanotransferase